MGIIFAVGIVAVFAEIAMVVVSPDALAGLTYCYSLTNYPKNPKQTKCYPPSLPNEQQNSQANHIVLELHFSFCGCRS